MVINFAKAFSRDGKVFFSGMAHVSNAMVATLNDQDNFTDVTALPPGTTLRGLPTLDAQGNLIVKWVAWVGE